MVNDVTMVISRGAETIKKLFPFPSHVALECAAVHTLGP